MSEISSTLYTTSFYVFGSPRYNCIRNYPTILAPEDYTSYDGLNGTCDKYFPCYTLTSNDKPITEFVNEKGEVVKNEGAFGFREHQPKTKFKIVGKKDNPDSPSNSTLARHKIYEDLYITSKLNPGWCVIQSQQKQESETAKIENVPQFVVRALGNNGSMRQLYALDLDAQEPQALNMTTVGFLAGDIVVYKSNLFKCLKDTVVFPPTSAVDNEEWKYMNFENVFNADLFALTPEKSAYFMDVSDENRKFDPTKADDTLMCWSVAYHHTS